MSAYTAFTTPTTPVTQRQLPVFRLFPATLFLLLVGITTVLFPHQTAKAADPSWIWQNPLPQGNSLNGVWGASATDVFAVGNLGTIMHYDGIEWTIMSSGVSKKLWNAWGTAANNVYAIGDTGTLLHYDGSTWSAIPLGYTNNLYAIWGTGANDIFVTGGSGIILHYDGSTWSAMTSGTLYALRGVWGSSSTNVFAAGSAGVILHYDGTTWTEMTSGVISTFNDVWGTAANNVYAVGSNGTILKFNGTAWNAVTSNTTSGLFDIWGVSASSIYAAGESGAVVRYDGSSWAKMVTNTSSSFHGLWGSSAADIYAVGYAGAIRHYNGTAWSSMNSGITTSFNGIWVASQSEAFAVGSSGRIAHYDGSAWAAMTSGTTFSLRAVWGFAANQVFAVGDNGVVLFYNGVNWSSLPTGSISTLRDLWGSSATDLFVAGNAGTILHYNGSTWTAMESKTTATIWDVWGSGPTDVFAVGDDGLILHYDGATWSSMTSGTDKTLRGVWGSSPTNVFAVGASGTVRLYNGSTWNYVGTGTASTLYGVWGSSATNVFAVGTLGGALRYSGSGTFTILNSGTSSNLADVSGSTGAMVLAAGYGGTIIRYGAASNVSKAVIAPNPTPGQPITYTLAFSNTGLLKLTKVRLYDSVPPTVTINAVSTSGVTMVSIGAAPNYAWQVADLTPGAGGLVTLTGVISPTAPGGRVVLNQAILGAAGELTTTGESTFTVLPASTSITMTSAPTPTTVYGQITTLTATVSAKAPATGKPSGTVTFRKGATVLGTGTLGANGKAAINVTTLATGANQVVATYNGDSNFLAATATTHTHTVVRAGTTNLVIAAPNPADLEQNVTATAYVAAASPGAGTPTGVVTFYLGSRVVTAGLTAGAASMQTSTLPSGVTAITATYSGDGNFLPSTSGVFSETVRCRVYVTNVNDSGPGSLRAAVTDACLATTILFTPTLQGQTILLTSGEIAIDKYINIEGLGSAHLTISGNDAGRIFNITPGFYSLVKDLKLEHGRNLAGSGGAILNQGILQVEGVVIANSAAMHGGAIANQGTLTVTNSSFTSNSALSNGGALADASAGATYAIDGSTFQGNQAGNHGGVLYSAGAVDLAGSIFAGNSAQVDGGALYQSGAITITASTFTGNRASSDGGAAYVGASAIVSNSAFLTNSATANGGGWYQEGANPWSCIFCTFSSNTAANGGAMAIAGGDTALTAVSVAGNSATGSGGGLVLIGGAAVLDNSTFHQNSAVSGGAINNMAHATLKNVTLVNNTASGALGGGVNVGGVAVLTLSNSVLSNPTGGDCANSGTLSDGGYNIARDATCNLNAANHSQASTNALLGTFGDYGGNVHTAPLLPGSPAIDGGDLTMCAASALGAFDARGVARPQGSSCDCGAYEAQAVTLAIANGDHQKTYVNTAFAQPLSAGVTGATWEGEIEPVNGGWVRFTAPATGPGATFAPSTTVTIASGAAQLPATANAATGAYSATVAPAGPGNSVAFDLGNELRATSVAQAIAPNPALVKQTVTLTVTVTDKTGFATPSGSVQVTEASGAFDNSLTLSNGVATWNLPELTAGVYTVTATYGGDAVHASARSKSTRFTIEKFDTALALAAAPNPAKVGENITFTATLGTMDTFDLSTTALPAPTGQVQFIDEDDVTLATVALANSQAIFATSALPAGDHTVFARYLADALYAGSDSDPASITVIERATKTTLKATPNPAIAGQTVVVTATVTENALATADVAETGDAEEKDLDARASAAAISPTGNVTFLDGDGGELGVVPLTGGKATLRLTNLIAGNHIVIGHYAGDSRYAQSESASLTIKVQALPLAVNDAAGALPGEAVLVTVLANDSDPAKGGLTVIDVETPSHGVAAIAGSGQQVRYTATAGFTGVDTFNYTMSDVNDHTDQATVFVIVGSREHADAPPKVQIFDPAQKGTTTFAGSTVDLDLAWQAGFFVDATQDKDIYFFSFTDYVTPTEHTASPPVNYEFGNLNFALDVYLNEQKLDGTQLTTPITTTLGYGPDLLGTLRAETLALFRWAGANWSQNGITEVSHTPELQTMVVELSDVGEFAFYAAPAATANIYMPLLATRNAVTGVEPPKSGVPAVAPTPNASAPRAGVTQAAWSDQVYLPAVKK